MAPTTKESQHWLALLPLREWSNGLIKVTRFDKKKWSKIWRECSGQRLATLKTMSRRTGLMVFEHIFFFFLKIFSHQRKIYVEPYSNGCPAFSIVSSGVMKVVNEKILSFFLIKNTFCHGQKYLFFSKYLIIVKSTKSSFEKLHKSYIKNILKYVQKIVFWSQYLPFLGLLESPARTLFERSLLW